MNEATNKAMTTTENDVQNNADSLKTNVVNKIEDVKTVASEKFEAVKSTVADTLGNSQSVVADKLHQAADSLQQKVGGATDGGAMAKYGQKAADMLDRSADYVGDFDPNRVKTDVQNHVKQNPGRSLLIAGAVGLILGALFSRSRRDY